MSIFTQPLGIIAPLRRDKKSDFASGAGEALLVSKVEQVLMTEGKTPRSEGELLWRTDFGAGLALLRHQFGDDAQAELARVYVRDALSRWLPGVEIRSLTVESRDNVMSIRLRVREGDVTADVEVVR